MEPDLDTELLDLASAPDAGLVEVLERAVHRLAADSGAHAAVLVVFDPATAAPAPVAAAGCGRLDGAPEGFAHEVCQDGGRLARACRNGELDLLTDTSPGLGRPADGASLSGRSRSSLWLTLAENHRPVALLALEAERPGAFREPLVRKLQARARRSLPALQRALLRHLLREAGGPADVVGSSAAFLDLER
ncbi:MAG TPA: hypothetical protein VLF66_02180, partial [Thermoanaerobaculia bacterium]|nr:hypothetical protein [Thermoanaerobaculia bacterium]